MEENTNHSPPTEETPGGDEVSYSRAFMQAIQQQGQGVDTNELLAELAKVAPEYVTKAATAVKLRAAENVQAPLRRQYEAELARMGGRSKNLDRIHNLRSKYRKMGLDI